VPLCITPSLTLPLRSLTAFPRSFLFQRLKGCGAGCEKISRQPSALSLQFSGRANYGLKSYISGEDRFVRQVEAGLAEEAGYGVFVEAGGVE
jgi:hypothetical protein